MYEKSLQLDVDGIHIPSYTLISEVSQAVIHNYDSTLIVPFTKPIVASLS